jgi:hypothetical protein
VCNRDLVVVLVFGLVILVATMVVVVVGVIADQGKAHAFTDR